MPCARPWHGSCVRAPHVRNPHSPLPPSLFLARPRPCLEAPLPARARPLPPPPTHPTETTHTFGDIPHAPRPLPAHTGRHWQTNLDTLTGVLGVSRAQARTTVQAFPSLLNRDAAELHRHGRGTLQGGEAPPHPERDCSTPAWLVRGVLGAW